MRHTAATPNVLDPFMGSGSTVAAAIANGYEAVGVELDDEYFAMAKRAVPILAAMPVEGDVTERKIATFVEPLELFTGTE